MLVAFCRLGVFVDKSATCGGATVYWSICGKFLPIFVFFSTGSKVSAATISLRSDFAVASSRGGMVGEGIGSLCLLSLVWF